MSPISPSDSNMARLHMEQQDLVQKRLDMDALRERLNGRPDKQAKLREACEGFETVFIQKMWEQMRKNVQQSSYLHSRDEHMYQAMYDGEFAKKMSQAGGIGLADMLYDQLSQRLGESSRTTSPRNDPRLPIIPAVSSVTGIASPVKPLYGAADPAGMELHKNNIRPLYEDAPAAPPLAAPAAAALAEPAVPAAEPALAAYDEDLELEELSQALLNEELSGAEKAAEESARREGPQGLEVSLSTADTALLEAALRRNMAEAGRITAAQAPLPATGPASGPASFGTPLATDAANPADYAAVSAMNNSPRS